MTEENTSLPTPAPSMKVKLRPIGVPRDAPFSEDLLARGPLLDKLGRFVRNVQTPYVLAVDAPWGSGKSKLLEMWEATLETAGVPVVRFNAWEADFAPEPLGPILAALRHRFPEAAEPLLQRGKRVLKTYALAALPSVLKAATLGALDLAATESRLEDAEDALGDAVERAAERSVEAFDEQHAQVAGLGEVLERIAGESGGPDRRVVMMIDELDRCRPSFAVELLERVKHVLEVEGFVFVFALDRSQLAHSVRAVYGAEFDGEGYLGRFFDVVFRLPAPERRAFARTVLTNRLGWDAVVGGRGTEEERRLTVDFFTRFADYLQLTPREIEQCAGRLACLIYTVKEDHYLKPISKVVLAILAQCRRELYVDLISGPEGADRVLEALGMEARASIDRDGYWMTAVVGLLLSAPEDLFERPSARLANYRSSLDAPQGSATPADAAPAFPPLPSSEFVGVVVNLIDRERLRNGWGIRQAVDALQFTLDFHLGDSPAPAAGGLGAGR